MVKPPSGLEKKPVEYALNRPIRLNSGPFFFQRRLYLSDPWNMALVRSGTDLRRQVA
jgi:hypothetical protein